MVTVQIFVQQMCGCMDTWLLSWKKRGKLQTDIANMGLRVMLLLILLGNITFQKFHVNSAKIWNGSM